MSAITLGRGERHLLAQIVRAFSVNATSWIGLALFLAIVVLALLAPVISPYDPLDQDVLTRLPAAPAGQLEEFLPDRWQAARRAQPTPPPASVPDPTTPPAESTS